jgi:hypothetical protein
MSGQRGPIGGDFSLGSAWCGQWCERSIAPTATPSGGPLPRLMGRGDFAAWGADFARIQR